MSAAVWATVYDFPTNAGGSDVGQGRAPATIPRTDRATGSHPSERVAGDPTPIRKRGRDITVGDQIVNGGETFLVVGFTGRTPRARIAINVWGESLHITDRRLRTVLNPTASAANK